MGNLINIYSPSCKRIAVLGLNGAGKTSILYRLKLGDFQPRTCPTLEFNVEKVRHRRINMEMLDLAGRKFARESWTLSVGDKDALIFVVDSSDVRRMWEAQQELHRVVRNLPPREQPYSLLVYCNKQDLSKDKAVLSAPEIAGKLNLDLFPPGRLSWYMQQCDTVSGEGLEDGLDWLLQELSPKSYAKRFLKSSDITMGPSKQMSDEEFDRQLKLVLV